MKRRMPATNPATICALSRSGGGSSAVTAGTAEAICRLTAAGSPPRSVTADVSAACWATDANTGVSDSGSDSLTTTVNGSVDVIRASIVPSRSCASPALRSATSLVVIATFDS